MTELEYWERLKAAGFRNPKRTSERHYLMQSREGQPVSVADPAAFSSEERIATLEHILDVHGDWNKS